VTVNASDFLRAVQYREARIAVGASATRGQGAGTVIAARGFFSDLDLHRFGVAKPDLFRIQLDKATDELRLKLPRRAATWGLARKLTNIFLRGALYTTYLCEHFNLANAEAFLELPLDSITSRELRNRAGRGVLPRWQGVKRLTLDASDEYQSYAQECATKCRLARVHLDTFWWGVRDKEFSVNEC
jgi:hypothetical protein